MKTFMGENFLLENDAARKLYFDYARTMPIFDYHNHLSAREIFEKQSYANLTRLWLAGDHYKWRAMRVMGISEEFITGSASDYEKFMAWVSTVEKIPGNPLFHWTHLELQRYFGIDRPLCKSTAEQIWNQCNQMLQQPGFDASGLLEKMNVKALCTTDEPFDDLNWHLSIRNDSSSAIIVLPTFRPDRLVHIDDREFVKAVALMEKRFSCEINSLDDLKQALIKSLDHFGSAGCLLADHGFIKFEYDNKTGAGKIFEKVLSGQSPAQNEVAVYKGELLRFLAAEYEKRDWGMQLHLGAIRNNNTPMYVKLGPNCGFDSVGRITDPFQLSSFLDDLEITGTLPKTILYCLNSADNSMMATMAVNHASPRMPARMQFGAAWWFEDHYRGISNQIEQLMETGLLSGSVGMLTDSRSFTSFVRHEYFRRILCNKLGTLIEKGEYPSDFESVGGMVQDICFHNAVRFFGLVYGENHK